MKKIVFYPLLLIFAIGLLSCGNRENNTITNETTENNIINHSDFDSFWADFQKYMAEKNFEELKKMTVFGSDAISEDFYDSYFINDALIESIVATEATDLYAGEMTTREFSLEEVAVSDDGEVFGSAIFLYFEKVDGSWKLVYMMAAG